MRQGSKAAAVPIDCGEIENQRNDILKLRQIMRDELPQYTALRPWKSSLDLLVNWLLVAGYITAAIVSGHWLVWLVAMILIAGRQHAIAVIGHDGAHYRLARNKKLNDFMADFFCWLPLFFSHKRWQHEHILHHKYINTDQDPYLKDFRQFEVWHWPKTAWAALAAFARDIVGLNANSTMPAARRWAIISSFPPRLTKTEKFRALLFYGLLIIFLTVTNGWLYYLLLWLLPMLVFLTMYVRVRTIAEHLGLGDPTDISGTRHVDANILERMTVAPGNINYHIEHHLFPSVPYYNLPRLHKRLLKEPVYVKNAILRKGYFFGPKSVFAEIITGQPAANLSSY